MEMEVNITCDVDKVLALSYLKPLQGELKKISDEKKEDLKKSILKHGFSFPFFVWHSPSDGEIYILDGHQRRLALLDLKDEGYKIPQVPVIFIQAQTIEEAKSKLLVVASQYGEFTPEGVMDFMKDLDFEEISFASIPFMSMADVLESEELPAQTTTVSEHERTISSKEKEEIKNTYSDKIDSPIYKPKMEAPPKISELYSKEKTNELIEKIKKNHNIDMDTKAFLVEAAHRFTTFRYDLIAEFYAHSNKEVQELMESLVLVIVDFDKAVESGFVSLGEELNELLKKNLTKNLENSEEE